MRLREETFPVSRPSNELLPNCSSSLNSNEMPITSFKANNTQPLNIRISDLDNMVNNTLDEFSDQERSVAAECKMVHIT